MTRSLPAAVLLCLSINGFALDPADYGASLVSRTNEGGRTIVTLKDSSGRDFSLAYREEPSPGLGKTVVQLKDLFFAWKTISVSSLRFTMTDDTLDALIIPGKILVDGRDVRSFVPAGLLLSYSGALAYDFRVTTDNLFLRVRGAYAGEEEMTGKIAAAIANPASFLQRNDTEYVLSRVEKSEAAIDALAARLQALGNDYETLAAENAKLRAEVEAFRYAAMRRENVEWLFWRTPVPRDALRRVVELKRENPALGRGEVEAQLKKEGIRISGEALGIILEYYFNEFPAAE